MRLRWTSRATQDRTEIRQYVRKDSASAAARLDRLIGVETQRLKQFPYVGRAGRVPGTRELVLQHYPYLVAYEVADEQITVLRIMHGAQQWPLQI